MERHEVNSACGDEVSCRANGLLLPPDGEPERSWARWIATRSGGRLCYIPGARLPNPRWGHTREPHTLLTTILELNLSEYSRLIGRALDHSSYFSAITALKACNRHPYWHNGWFPPTDAVALSQMLVDRNPALLIEIGSGNSTKFARRAIDHFRLRTRLVSIDPQPRAEIDSLCDECHRKRLENCELSLFARLGPGDILFIDSSHRALMNSDVSVLFLDVLPSLPPGVIVHLHDIWLPFDYPARWSHWCFSEQYLLACFLLFARERYRVLFPSMYVSSQPRLRAQLIPIWTSAGITCPIHGGSFWFELVEPAKTP